MNAASLTTADVVRITQDLWGSMLNLDLTLADLPIPVTPEGIVAYVQMMGEWQGSVRLDISPILAHEVAAVFFGIPTAEVSPEQARICAGELANITAGGVQALVPAPSKISLPAVSDRAQCTLEMAEGNIVTQTAFDRHGEKFVVTICAFPVTTASALS